MYHDKGVLVTSARVRLALKLKFDGLLISSDCQTHSYGHYDEGELEDACYPSPRVSSLTSIPVRWFSVLAFILIRQWGWEVEEMVSDERWIQHEHICHRRDDVPSALRLLGIWTLSPSRHVEQVLPPRFYLKRISENHG